MMNQSVETTIVTRRSIKKTKGTELPQDVLNEIFEKAAYAPFHTKVEPWSITSISTKEEKEYYADCVINSFERIGKYENLTEEKVVSMKANQSEYFLTTPLTLLVTTDVFEKEKGNLDSIGATSSFIQNVSLLCWDKNIGVVWRTPQYIFDPIFAEDMGIDPTKKIVGAVHLGYFDEEIIPKPKVRRDINEWITPLASKGIVK